MPSFNRVRPILICRSVPTMIKFYEEILGFRIIDRIDDVGLSGWAALSRDHAELMLASPSYIPAPKDHEFPLNQMILYVEVSGLSQLRRDILVKHYAVSTLEDRFYGMREFELTDPEGHRIVFAEAITENEN